MIYTRIGWLLWQLRRWEVRTHHDGTRRFWTRAMAEDWARLGSGYRETWTVHRVRWIRAAEEVPVDEIPLTELDSLGDVDDVSLQVIRRRVSSLNGSSRSAHSN